LNKSAVSATALGTIKLITIFVKYFLTLCCHA
jgi:hypothetical protein